MGLGEFFAKRRETKRASTIAAMTARLKNPYGQQVDRKRCIDVLSEIGTDDAIRGLLLRFTYNADKSIVDEDEKEIIFNLLLSRGDAVVPLLKEYLSEQASIFWPLKALRKIVGDEETVTFLLGLIDSMEGDYVDTRHFERKLSLISQLRDFQDARIHERLLAWLSDPEEEIRFHAVDAIATYPDPQTTAVLADRLLVEDETARIRNFVLDLLIQNHWAIPKTHRKDLRTRIPEEFWIDDTGVIQRKK
jgi:HEAT repeat protein